MSARREGIGVMKDQQMRDGSDYAPIACSLHDELESLATRGRTVSVRYLDGRGATAEAADRIVDVFARGGAEYLRLARGAEIRLDRLVSVDGISFMRRG